MNQTLYYMPGPSPSLVTWRKPTVPRYVWLLSQLLNKKLLRALQYEILDKQALPGHVLDFGGGETASYRHLVRAAPVTSVNIDHELAPTVVVGVNDRLPFPDQNFDTVLSLNTFEHIYDADGRLRELARVIKPGGLFVTSVPFLYAVHGHPDDFFRPTPSWWHTTLTRLGFEGIEIEALHWGPFSTGAVASKLPGPFKYLRMGWWLLMDLLYAQVRRQQSKTAIRHALGYFVRAKRCIPPA